MNKTFNILTNSLRLTFEELKVNKIRTLLSLIGISFGIFCIIGVMALVNSLEQNVQNQLSGLGSNSIHIDKWRYQGGPDYPWWKFQKRPEMKFSEVNLIKERSRLAQAVAFSINTKVNVIYNDFALEGVRLEGDTKDKSQISPLKIQYGRNLTLNELENGSLVVVMGYTNAESLFVNPEQAVGKQVKIKNKIATVIGVVEKTGQNLIGENPDMSIYAPYKFVRQIVNEDFASPKIIVMGNPEVSPKALSDELEGIMRSIRKLKPTEEDNFTLNNIQAISEDVSKTFKQINLGGLAIGILSLVVGAFNIANIMFVTVKERTPIIGLKKAIGAKKRSILSEFLLEAAIICILGGVMGVLLVFLMTVLLTKFMGFPVFISVGVFSLAIFICILVGILAGIIPAYSAANLDPVVAIRSK